MLVTTNRGDVDEKDFFNQPQSRQSCQSSRLSMNWFTKQKGGVIAADMGIDALAGQGDTTL
jgi:hypothetical protein